MYVKKSDEQLVKEYAEIGVDYNKFVEFGEMNVIVQSFANEDHEQEEDEDGNEMSYLNFMPRKGYAAEESVNLDDEDGRKQFVAELRNSSERMKVWAYLLAKKADAIEKGVYDGTSVYYPQLEEWYDDGKKSTDE